MPLNWSLYGVPMTAKRIAYCHALVVSMNICAISGTCWGILAKIHLAAFAFICIGHGVVVFLTMVWWYTLLKVSKPVTCLQWLVS